MTDARLPTRSLTFIARSCLAQSQSCAVDHRAQLQGQMRVKCLYQGQLHGSRRGRGKKKKKTFPIHFSCLDFPRWSGIWSGNLLVRKLLVQPEPHHQKKQRRRVLTSSLLLVHFNQAWSLQHRKCCKICYTFMVNSFPHRYCTTSSSHLKALIFLCK